MKKFVTLLLIAFTAITTSSQAQPGTSCNADFTFQFTAPNTVKFTPVVIGDSFNTFHQWSFGDGATATIPLPVHVYATAGVFNVRHIIIKINPNGVEVCRDTLIKQILIQQQCNLVANFESHADAVNYLKIHFINTSIPLEPADSVRWTFGDGTSSLNVNAIHTYTNAGTYIVCLRVKKNNSAGTPVCVKEICKTIVVAPLCNLTAYFNWSATTANPLTVAFQNLTASLTATDSVRWTFGDGTSSLNVNAIHTYANAGTYTVCLRVKRNNTIGGTPCVSEICKTITVQSACNIAVNFTLHRDSTNPRKVYFSNTTVIPAATAIVKWSFGDGSFATSWNAVHEYALPGTYRVCLTIQTAANCVKEKCETIVIAPPPASCKDLSKFIVEKYTGDNQKYKFTPENISNDVVYTWTFGDGTGSKDVVATHRYTQPGLYIACLTAWRGPNCASTTCKEIRVLPQINCDSIHVGYTYQRDPFVLNKIYFYANANFPILDQTWTITKLSPATIPPVILHQNNPVYVFHDTGYYQVCLRAITLGGCVKEFCKVIRIERVINSVCELQAYPNPATNLINVNVPLTQPVIIHAYIYNTLNVLVKDKQQQGNTGSNIVTLNVSDLVPGLYTIKVVYGGKTCYARFTKL